MNVETLFIYLLLGGALIVLLGHLLMVIMAFRQSASWGLGVLLLPPLGGLAFIVKHFKRALPAILVMLLGGVLVGAAYVPAIFGEVRKDPVVRVEKGDVQLTLTGMENFNLAELEKRIDDPNLTMVQMANPEVTDLALLPLKRLKNLVNLDVSNSSITDDGLKTLAELPALRELRLARTKITDEGFRRHLLEKDGLMMLDLTGTAVRKESVQEWKKSKPGRRALQ